MIELCCRKNNSLVELILEFILFIVEGTIPFIKLISKCFLKRRSYRIRPFLKIYILYIKKDFFKNNINIFFKVDIYINDEIVIYLDLVTLFIFVVIQPDLERASEKALYFL